MKTWRLPLLFFLLNCSLIGSLHDYECILSYDVDIVVHVDATIAVTETIKVRSLGRMIRHGILRDFPTRYYGTFGTFYNVSFVPVKVLSDGYPVPYTVTNYANGKRMCIGDSDRLVPHGDHTYIISYTTNRQIGFFKDWDELYFNAIGTGWPFAIEKAMVQLQFQTIPADKISIEAYTGYQGKQRKSYQVESLGNKIVIKTTRILQPHEGLTIVATWPKGFVHKPSAWQQSRWFVRDNLHLMLIILALLLLIFYYFWVFRRIRHSICYGTVIPRFYPPENIEPGAMRYLLHKKYDGKALAAQIVQMAVKGLLLINYKKARWFGAGTYTLEPRVDREKVPTNYFELFTKLFSGDRPLVLNKENSTQIIRVNDFLKSAYRHAFDRYINYNYEYVLFGVLIVALFVGGALFLAPDFDVLSFVGIGFLVLINGIAAWWLPSYTQMGQVLVEEIEGFKLFLATTETERLKVIGTPPERTPELYETYLPYAIALDCEEQWSKQFVPVFKRLEEEGRAYISVWYVGVGRFNALQAQQMSASIGNAISSSIAASTSRPGSTSGTGGRGSAGGGGGGGGGGGW